MPSGLSVSIIVPAFNEEKALGSVIADLKKLRPADEVIVVDDGSTDGTAAVAEQLQVKVIRHLHNKGYGAALKTGIRNATGEAVLFFDADGQHDPEEIKKVITDMDKYDMVVGVRTRHSVQSFRRRPGKRLLSVVANLLAGMRIPDLNSGFRALRKEVVQEFMHILPNTFSFSTTITLALLKGGYEVKYVPITTRKRVGQSSVNQVSDGLRTIVLILKIVMLFDPLKIFLPASVGLLGTGIIFTVYTLIRFHSIWKSGSLLVISGIMIFFFGLLADQIASVRREIKGREE